MNIDAGDNLGNQRSVERVPVTNFYTGIVNETDSVTGDGGTNHMVERGTLIAFWTTEAGKPTSKQHACEMRGKAYDWLMKPGGGGHGHGFNPHTAAYGILAESVSDSLRRRIRPGRKPIPIVLPITFSGVDVVQAFPGNHHTADTFLMPADALYYNMETCGFKTRKDKITFKLTKTDVYVGVVHVGTDRAENLVQCRVDLLSTRIPRDPSVY